VGHGFSSQTVDEITSRDGRHCQFRRCWEEQLCHRAPTSISLDTPLSDKLFAFALSLVERIGKNSRLF
jgi:hypothetical protein